MSSNSDSSNTRIYSASDFDSIIKESINKYLEDIRDKAERRLVSAFFESLRAAAYEKVSFGSGGDQAELLGEWDILRIVLRLIHQGRVKDFNNAVLCLNAAIKNLKSRTEINLPLIDASKISVKGFRDLAVVIDTDRWEAYNKVELLYEHFITEFKVDDNEEDLAMAAVFSMIVNGVFFKNARISIMDISVRDFSPEHSYILLASPNSENKDKLQHKSRWFISAISVIYLLRCVDQLSLKPKLGDDKLFPEPVRQNFVKKFGRWLEKLVRSFNEYNEHRTQNEGADPIDRLTLTNLYSGARIWTAQRYPFFTTAYLRKEFVPGRLSLTNYKAQFSTDPVVYSIPYGQKDIRSWTKLKIEEGDENDRPLSADENDRPLSADEYVQLQNVHMEVCGILKRLENGGKQVRELAAEQIDLIAQSLPYTQPIINGYFANYALLLEWLSGMLVTKTKQNIITIKDYFCDLANSFFFIIEDACILGFDRHELMDVASDLIHASPSPRTQRTNKNKLRQFLGFLARRHQVPALNWNHPDLRIYDEPLEREILGLREFDTVIEYLDELYDRDYADSIKALMILLYYCGLRIHEAAALAHDAIFIDLELNIIIKKSKTRSGERSLPLHLILPQRELAFFRKIVQSRRPKGSRKGIPLFTPGGKAFYDPDKLAAMVTGAISTAIGRHITCHQLRHSFASWLLLRWYAYVYGTDALKTFYADQLHAAFTDIELGKIKTLLLGEGPERIGSKYFMRAIWAISRLLGHASPETTITVYIHTIDILLRLFIAEVDSSTLVSIPRAVNIINSTYPTVKAIADEADAVSLKILLDKCIERYKIPAY